MSKLRVYAVYDSKVKAYMNPFFMRSDGEALRGWMDVCNDKSTQFNKHPGDFSLMALGEYDEQSGKFSCEAAPRSLGLAVEFVRRPEEDRQVASPVSAVV